MKEKDLGDMKLHDKVWVDNHSTTILRVIGGWIYTHHRLDANIMTSVFVPEVLCCEIQGNINNDY